MRQGFHLKNGYVVMAIPDTGLFVKDGQLRTGHGTEPAFNELILFSRVADAEAHAEKNNKYWAYNTGEGRHWNFKVLPVLVSERL
ncbi:MAG: hypothetical protein ACLQVL_36725 [Terriglobia bacterium]